LCDVAKERKRNKIKISQEKRLKESSEMKREKEDKIRPKKKG
jgi:hypothetical protein